MTSLPSWLTAIPLPMPVTLGEVNVYLIQGPGGAALIDTGLRDASSAKELARILDRKGLAFGDIDTLVCTHHHADHAGLGKTLADAGAATMMSGQDAASMKLFFERPDLDSDRTAFLGRHELPDGFTDRVAPMFPFFRSLGERFEPAVQLTDGQEIGLGGIPFVVMLTPGHTPGHICLFQPDAHLVFTGDCIISGDVTHMSMGSATQGDPLGMFIRSLERLRSLGSPLCLPGHGPLILDLPSRTEQLLTHHRIRLEQVEGALGREPRSAFDISAEVMGYRPKAVAAWLALSQTLGYLEHLVRSDRAVEVDLGDAVRYRKIHI